MLVFGHSRQYRQLRALLKQGGFYKDNFRHYHINAIIDSIRQNKLIASLVDVITTAKLTHVLLLKAALLIFRYIQVIPDNQESKAVQILIEKLTGLTKTMLLKSYENKPRKVIFKTKSNMHLQSNFLASQQIKLKQTEQTVIYPNSISFLIAQVVQPLLSIASKVMACQQLVYHPRQMNLQTCWATLNLLRKYLQLGKVFDQIGRYYQKQFSNAVVFVISILNTDVQNLYYRTVCYLKNKIEPIQNILQQRTLVSAAVATDIKQVLLIVEELQTINENIRVMYLSKYFANAFKANDIFMPILFRSEHIVQLLYSVVSKQVMNKKRIAAKLRTYSERAQNGRRQDKILLQNVSADVSNDQNLG